MLIWNSSNTSLWPNYCCRVLLPNINFKKCKILMFWMHHGYMILHTTWYIDSLKCNINSCYSFKWYFCRRKTDPNLQWRKPCLLTMRQKDRHYLGKNHFRFPTSFPRLRRRRCLHRSRWPARTVCPVGVTSPFPRAQSPRTMQHYQRNQTLSLDVSVCLKLAQHVESVGFRVYLFDEMCGWMGVNAWTRVKKKLFLKIFLPIYAF